MECPCIGVTSQFGMQQTKTSMTAIMLDPLALIPPPAAVRLALRVTPAAQRALRAGHPWLFDQAITAQSGAGQPGDLAVIFDDRRRFLAIGLYDPTSLIRVRILQRGTPAKIDSEWLHTKLTAAAEWRATLSEHGTTGYRLIHGENDGLPGLIVDRYADTLVVKLYSLAWLPWLADLCAALAEVASHAALALAAKPAVVLRLSRELMRHTDALHGLADGILLAGALPNSMEDEPFGPSTRSGPEGVALFSENGLRFEADVLRGQKTGFFFDQRDNRARVEGLAAGKRTLNVFAYTGGFSLYAARGGAAEILSLDSSAPALAAAERNFGRNRHLPAIAAAQHTTLVADAFEALAALRGPRYDLVIVDPPALAKQESEITRALQTYSRLTGLAQGVLAPGGTLVMASCSSRVSAPAFFAVVNRAAAQAGRPLHELDRTGHAIDHPVIFPEGAYLKCLFATVP